MSRFRKLSHSIWHCQYHIVWVPKYRFKILEGNLLTIKAPEGGSGYLFVESATNLLTLPVTIPSEGSTVSIEIDPLWQRHDIYISALIVRPGEIRSGHLPKRAVGLLIHLPLDRSMCRLSLDIQMPSQTESSRIEPLKRIEVPTSGDTGGISF